MSITKSIWHVWFIYFNYWKICNTSKFIKFCQLKLKRLKMSKTYCLGCSKLPRRLLLILRYGYVLEFLSSVLYFFTANINFNKILKWMYFNTLSSSEYILQAVILRLASLVFVFLLVSTLSGLQFVIYNFSLIILFYSPFHMVSD